MLKRILIMLLARDRSQMHQEHKKSNKTIEHKNKDTDTGTDTDKNKDKDNSPDN